MQQPSSNIFEGYRSLGNVTSDKEFIVRYGQRPDDVKIITIVGRTFHCYNSKLALVEASLPHEFDIETITSDQNQIYSAAANTIFCWKNSGKHLLYRLVCPNNARVHILCRMGGKLISVNSESSLLIWSLSEAGANKRSDEMIEGQLKFDNGTFEITCLLHPMDYPNKVLLGSTQGQLQLWNIKSEQLLYSFSGWNSQRVTCLQQSPTIDVVGIGLQDGTVILHNIRFDEVILKLHQEFGAITSMAFRSDGEAHMATASEFGHVILWNLEKRRLQAQMRDCHLGPVRCCRFVKNQPLMLTNGADNSLKMWSLDTSDGGGTLLHVRNGHARPPNCIRFYGAKGFHILSGGEDSTMKMFHVLSERLNRNMGTARLNPKSKEKVNDATRLPPITRFSAEQAKEGQWDNIVACHRGLSDVTTWNSHKCSMGIHRFSHPTFNKHNIEATCVDITNCGNFVCIGYSHGNIFRYNLQSGFFRMNYHDLKLSNDCAHDGLVSGLVVDALDSILVSGGQDGKLKFWNFKTGSLLQILDLFPLDSMKVKIDQIVLQRDNNLIAVSLQIFSVNENKQEDVQDRLSTGEDGGIKFVKIAIIDIETRSLIRIFKYGTENITDMSFFNDSRWFIAASYDKTIKVWDISLNKLIDSFSFTQACISLSVSPTGEFLATAHMSQLGINLWSNRTIYCPTPIRVLPDDHVCRLLDMPHVRSDDLYDESDENDQLEDQEKDIREVEYESPDQLDRHLLSLSQLPTSKWKNLLQLDSIRQQQLIDEQQADQQRDQRIPFFIPTVAGLKPKLDLQTKMGEDDDIYGANEEQEELYKSRIRKLSLISSFGKKLMEADESGDFSKFFCTFKELGPSAIDAELRSMGSDTCGHNRLLLAFLRALTALSKTNQDFELLNSWLALFVKIHFDELRNSERLNLYSCKLLKNVEQNWDRLSTETDRVFCVLNFIRSSIL